MGPCSLHDANLMSSYSGPSGQNALHAAVLHGEGDILSVPFEAGAARSQLIGNTFI